MSHPEDPLDTLLKRSAPGRVPAGFADRVVAAARARRRWRRLRRAVLGVAAVVAIGLALRGYMGLAPEELGATHGPRHVARLVPRPEPRVEQDEAEEAGSFAVQLESTGESRQRVMMARINGTYLLVAKPNDAMADELDEMLRIPTAVVGALSSGSSSGAMAAQLGR